MKIVLTLEREHDNRGSPWYEIAQQSTKRCIENALEKPMRFGTNFVTIWDPFLDPWGSQKGTFWASVIHGERSAR